MSYYKIFYWLTVADNAKSFFWFFAVVFTLIALISTIAYFSTIENDEGQKMSRKWMWWCYPFMILFWAGIIFTPSKKDSLLILAGGGAMNFLTTDSTAKELPHELTAFVVTELKSMAKEAQVEMMTNDYKQSVLERAKKMTGGELIEAMKDSAFASIVLQK